VEAVELDGRKRLILNAIIKDYIQNAEPVGSRTLAKKYEMGLSSATIRNEMADLEDLGYLEQPHTSAGRIPSDKGYRLYVDKLMKINSPSKEEIITINSFMQLATINEIEKIMKRTTKLLSQITKYTSAMLTPQLSKSTVKSIQLIQVTQNDVLAVIVTDTGMIKNVLIKLPRVINDSNLIKINNMLNDKLKGLTCEDIDLSVITSIQNEIGGYYEILNAIIPILHESLNTLETDVYLEGATNILNYPEYNDLDKAKSLLVLMDKREILGDIFSEGQGKLSISIGSENEFDEMKDCSIVKASYSIGDNSIGKIGIIGPRRMNYSKVIGILNCLVDVLNDVLKSHNEDY
jgi:heat-inducible transcriptional repressor